jgi:hypothetical protein
LAKIVSQRITVSPYSTFDVLFRFCRNQVGEVGVFRVCNPEKPGHTPEKHPLKPKNLEPEKKFFQISVLVCSKCVTRFETQPETHPKP